MMKYEMYHLRAISDIHPGTGKDEFSPIDQQVQRNSFGHPTIQYSAVKGATRERFENQFGENSDEVVHMFGGKKSVKNVIEDDFIAAEGRAKLDFKENEELKRLLGKIFGADADVNRAGNYKYNECLLISLPVRSQPGVYANVFCPLILNQIFAQIQISNSSDPEVNALKLLCTDLLNMAANNPAEMPISLSEFTSTGTILEDDRVIVKKVIQLDRLEFLLSVFGEFPVLISDADFKLLSDNFHLPVIQRNSLKKDKIGEVDGIAIYQILSDNLWTEQIIPRWSRFLTLVAIPESDIYRNLFIENTNEKVIDLGGNLSTGYGSLYSRRFSNVWNPLEQDASSFRTKTN